MRDLDQMLNRCAIKQSNMLERIYHLMIREIFRQGKPGQYDEYVINMRCFRKRTQLMKARHMLSGKPVASHDLIG